MVNNLIEKPEPKNNGFTGRENKYRASSNRFPVVLQISPVGIPGRNSPWNPKKTNYVKTILRQQYSLHQKAKKKARKSAKLRKLGK